MRVFFRPYKYQMFLNTTQYEAFVGFFGDEKVPVRTNPSYGITASILEYKSSYGLPKTSIVLVSLELLE
jgi:hypothetical protein